MQILRKIYTKMLKITGFLPNHWPTTTWAGGLDKLTHGFLSSLRPELPLVCHRSIEHLPSTRPLQELNQPILQHLHVACPAFPHYENAPAEPPKMPLHADVPFSV